jgi:hypothetical protein
MTPPKTAGAWPPRCRRRKAVSRRLNSAARDAWTAIAPMPHPRHGLGAVTLDGAIHVIGGALKASGVETSALVEIYRP